MKCARLNTQTHFYLLCVLYNLSSVSQVQVNTSLE